MEKSGGGEMAAQSPLFTLSFSLENEFEAEKLPLR